MTDYRTDIGIDRDICIFANDDRFIKEVIHNHEYSFLYDYDTVVDIGANIGTFSYYVYPHANRIFAVEPHPSAVSLMIQTVKYNKLDKITVCEYAITQSSGDRLLAVGKGDIALGSGMINDKAGITVQSLSMEDFMNLYKIDYIDLLKVDIEGGEKDLFESQAFHNVANRIGAIIGETHGESKMTATGWNLTKLGFKFTNLRTRFLARKK